MRVKDTYQRRSSAYSGNGRFCNVLQILADKWEEEANYTAKPLTTEHDKLKEQKDSGSSEAKESVPKQEEDDSDDDDMIGPPLPPTMSQAETNKSDSFAVPQGKPKMKKSVGADSGEEDGSDDEEDDLVSATNTNENILSSLISTHSCVSFGRLVPRTKTTVSVCRIQ